MQRNQAFLTWNLMKDYSFSAEHLPGPPGKCWEEGKYNEEGQVKWREKQRRGKVGICWTDSDRSKRSRSRTVWVTLGNKLTDDSHLDLFGRKVQSLEFPNTTPFGTPFWESSEHRPSHPRSAVSSRLARPSRKFGGLQDPVRCVLAPTMRKRGGNQRHRTVSGCCSQSNALGTRGHPAWCLGMCLGPAPSELRR